MAYLELVRTEHLDTCTKGRLYLDGTFMCHTLELPWKNNATNVSCIPGGTYDTVWWESPTHGKVLRLADVPNRTDILIHIGNAPEDILGCIAVGTKYYRAQDAVGYSAVAMNKLRTLAVTASVLTVKGFETKVPEDG